VYAAEGLRVYALEGLQICMYVAEGLQLGM
jgi:hypothetical protein